jgi:serine/threonine protein kinase
VGNIEPGGSLSNLPTQFGKYSILGHLATGGMAEVYLARQAGLEGFEKVVVIKRVRPELDDAQTTALFLDEARLVATLEHPNIAQVHEIGLVNGSYFFVMEYVHGADLRHVMEASIKQRRRVSLADAIYTIVHVCSALHYAHEKTDPDGNPLNIIHRDVSPSNVLLSHDGAVKVCDFGIARATSRQTETNKGTLKGKFSYMSPEQCRSQPLDRRSDVFSIGVLLYELSTLTRLFKAESDFELLRTIIEGDTPPPSTRIADYPPELERIVMRALQKDPAERYQTAQEMQLDLEEFAREQKLAMSSVNIAKMMGQRFEKRTDALSKAASRDSSSLPVFLPVGSGDESEISITSEVNTTSVGGTPTLTPSRSRPSEPAVPAPAAPAPVSAPAAGPKPRRRRPSVLWVIGAVIAGIAAGGATLADQILTRMAQADTRKALEADVEHIASTLDSAVRSAQMRAEGVASALPVRAAIETDPETMKDFASHEYMFPLAKNERAEVFLVPASGPPVSMLRQPASTAPLPIKSAQTTRLINEHDQLVLVVSAPIMGYRKSTPGAIALGVPVDLSLAVHSLGEHASQAWLSGVGSDVTLLDTHPKAPNPPISVDVRSNSELAATKLSIVVVPIAAASPGWARPVQFGGLAVVVLMLMMYFVGLRRSRS